MDAVLLMSEMFPDEGFRGDCSDREAGDLYRDGGTAGEDASSVGAEPFGEVGLQRGAAVQWGAAVFDFRKLEGTCAYCAPEAEEELSARLRGAGPEGVHFIDSGDYHYLSEILLRSASEPFELLLWDNHPDDQPAAFGSLFADGGSDSAELFADGGSADGMLSCGSWVKRLRETCHFCRGTHWFRSAEDFDLWYSGNGGPAAAGKGLSPREDTNEAGQKLPVYISIDLDVLRWEDARTNWDQGAMTLAELCREIRLATSSRRMIGADICGGLSASKGGRACDFSINSNTRRTLYKLLQG